MKEINVTFDYGDCFTHYDDVKYARYFVEKNTIVVYRYDEKRKQESFVILENVTYVQGDCEVVVV